MPQHFKIYVGDKLVGHLSTRNKGGTRYDITLEVPELEVTRELTGVDTGVQRQPQERKAQIEDFRDDFTHVMRCVAGVVASAEDLLRWLENHSSSGHAEMKPMTMRLMTNKFDRGVITVNPSNGKSVDVKVSIGIGTTRVPDALPKSECQLSWDGVELSSSGSQTERALKILKSIAPSLLQELSERAVE